jgi:hypothetical protein
MGDTAPAFHGRAIESSVMLPLAAFLLSVNIAGRHLQDDAAQCRQYDTVGAVF